MLSERITPPMLLPLLAIVVLMFTPIPAGAGVGAFLEVADLGYRAKMLNPGEAQEMDCAVGDQIKFGSGAVVMKVRVEDVDPTADDPSDVKITKIEIDNDNGSATEADIAQIAIVDKDNRCILEAPQNVTDFPVTFDAEDFLIPDGQEDVIQIAVRLEDSQTLEDNAEGHTLKLRARITYEERPSGAPGWETATKDVIDGGPDEVIHNGGFESAVDENYDGGIIPINGGGIVQEFTVCDDDALGDDPVIDEIWVMNKEDSESESADYNDIATIQLFVKGETTPRASWTPSTDWVPGTFKKITPEDFALIVRDDHCLTLQIGVIISPWAYPGHVIQLRTLISTYEPDTRPSDAGEIHPSMDPEVVDGTAEVIGESPGYLVSIVGAHSPAKIPSDAEGVIVIRWDSADPEKGLGSLHGIISWDPKLLDPIDDPLDQTDDKDRAFELFAIEDGTGEDLSAGYELTWATVDHNLGKAEFILTYKFDSGIDPVVHGTLLRLWLKGLGSAGSRTPVTFDLLGAEEVHWTMVGGEPTAEVSDITAETYVSQGEVLLVVPGDIDGDGEVTVHDATLLARHLVGLITLSKEELLIADVAPPYRTEVEPSEPWITSADVAEIARLAITIGGVGLAGSAALSGPGSSVGAGGLKVEVESVSLASRNGTLEIGVEGQGITAVKLEVYNLAGRMVFDSGFRAGDLLEWNLSGNRGEVLANGVYLYAVAARGEGGAMVRSGLKKLVILR